jgi:hypothetical protein
MALQPLPWFAWVSWDGIVIYDRKGFYGELLMKLPRGASVFGNMTISADLDNPPEGDLAGEEEVYSRATAIVVFPIRG